MPVFEITTPTGTFEVEAPDEQQALDALEASGEMGDAPASQGAPAGNGVTGNDIADSGLTGLRQGVESTAGMFGDAAQMQGDLAGWAAGKFGASPETQANVSQWGRRLFPMAGGAPTTAEIQSLTKPVVGEHYQPQSVGGEYMRTFGQFAPAAVAGPGGVLRKGAMTLAPAIASETAGQVTKGTAAEPYARAAGALAGGVAATRRPSAPKPPVPTSKEWKTSADQAFERMRQEGVTFTKQAFDDLDTRIRTYLDKREYWHENQPGIRGGLAKLEDIKSRGGTMTPDSLMALRQRFSGGYIQGNKQNNAMVREAINLIDDMLRNPKKGFVAATGDAASAAKAYKDGMTASRNQHKLEDVEYLVNKGQRQGDRNIIDNASKRVKTLLSDKLLDEHNPMSRGWNEAEKAAIKKASSWSVGERLAHAASGASPQGKLSGFGHMLVAGSNIATGNLPGLAWQAAAGAAGWTAGRVAAALARKPVVELTRLIASGGVKPEMTQDILRKLSKDKREALVRAILALESGKNSAIANSTIQERNY